MKAVKIDTDYLQRVLMHLLSVHSPSGYTDPVVRVLCEELEKLKIPYEITRRGAVRATLRGRAYSPDRALVTHLDTLGAMVKRRKDNGRLAIVPVGTWAARFAEGARVSVYTDDGVHRGTILPLKASGHIFNKEVDTQPSSWDNLEIRLDEKCNSEQDLVDHGIHIGDFVGVDSRAEILENGYINARHLDDKAGVALLLAAAKSIKDGKLELPVECHLLFTISEEVGSGASAVLHGDVAEMVSIDNGTIGPGQNTNERGATVVMADSSGPFDYHLTRHIINLCQFRKIEHTRDIFKYYRCDGASAIEAGNDIRTALIAYGVDGSHGYERTHLDSLEATAKLIVEYLKSDLVYKRQRKVFGTIKTFPKTRKADVGVKQAEMQEAVVQVPPPKPVNRSKSTAVRGKKRK